MTKEEQNLMVYLPYIMHAQFKAKAAQVGRSMSSIVRELVGNYLDENPPEFPLTEWRALYDAREKELQEAQAEVARKAREKAEKQLVEIEALPVK